MLKSIHPELSHIFLTNTKMFGSLFNYSRCIPVYKDCEQVKFRYKRMPMQTCALFATSNLRVIEKEGNFYEIEMHNVKERKVNRNTGTDKNCWVWTIEY